MKNNKGFAISGIMYAILIISLLLVLGTLKTIQNRKTIIDKVKSETVNALDSNNYQNILNSYQQLLVRVENLESNTSAKIDLPVGSIHISVTDNTLDKVKEHFEGEWEAFGQGRTLIGAGTNGGYTFTSQSTGTTVGATTNPLGEYNHTLKEEEMPKHNHVGRIGYSQSGWGIEIGTYQAYIDASITNQVVKLTGGTALTNKNLRSILKTSDTGSSQSHNNIQPYIVTYMWKRTS